MLYMTQNIKPQLWDISPGQVWINSLRMGLPMPVGLWQMWEGSGDKIYDLSGNGNGGAFINSPAWLNRAVSLSGINNGPYIDCGISPSLDISYISVVIRVKINSLVGTSGDNLCGIVGKWDTGANQRQYAFFTSSDGLFFYLSQSGGAPYNAALISAGQINLGQWYTFVGTYNGDNTIIYTDGVEAVRDNRFANFNGPINTVNTDIFLIGAQRTNNVVYREFDGDIEYVQVYDRALTSTQVAILYADPYGLTRQSDTLAILAAALAEAKEVVVDGCMTVAFDSKQPSIEFNSQQPSIEFNSQQPSVTFKGRCV